MKVLVEHKSSPAQRPYDGGERDFGVKRGKELPATSGGVLSSASRSPLATAGDTLPY